MSLTLGKYIDDLGEVQAARARAEAGSKNAEGTEAVAKLVTEAPEAVQRTIETRTEAEIEQYLQVMETVRHGVGYAVSELEIRQAEVTDLPGNVAGEYELSSTEIDLDAVYKYTPAQVAHTIGHEFLHKYQFARAQARGENMAGVSTEVLENLTEEANTRMLRGERGYRQYDGAVNRLVGRLDKVADKDGQGRAVNRTTLADAVVAGEADWLMRVEAAGAENPPMGGSASAKAEGRALRV